MNKSATDLVCIVNGHDWWIVDPHLNKFRGYWCKQCLRKTARPLTLEDLGL